VRCRVGHHGHVVAYVAEALGECDARVDGGLASRHRHVRDVGDEEGELRGRLGETFTTVMVSLGKSCVTLAISFPRSSQLT
jgi:hypothetical protein